MKYKTALQFLIAVTLLCSCHSNIKRQMYSLYRLTPSSCEEAVNQYQKLVDLKQKFYFEVNPTDTSSWRKVDRLKEEKKLIEAITIDSTCIDAYKLLGDIRTISLTRFDSLKESALRWYLKGLKVDPKNAELNLRIAYVYDLFDSVALARKYYDRVDREMVEIKSINGFGKKSVSVREILHKIDCADSLFHFFEQNKNDSYILLRREPTYTFAKPPETYCKVWGNGKVEYHDYFGNSQSPIHFETTISDSQISYLLKPLVDVRFLALYNLFKPDYPIAVDFEYVTQWHLPHYFITYYTPKVSHQVSIYGLGTIYGENSLQDVSSITYVSSLNVPSNSYISKKLGKLSAFWSHVFSSKSIYDKSKKK